MRGVLVRPPLGIVAAFGFAAALLLSACSDERIAPVPAEAPKAPPFRHEAFCDTLRSNADAFTMREGDWLEDQGDAPFYGLAFYAQRSYGALDEAARDRAEQSRTRALALIHDVDFFQADLQEVTMSALGLIEYAAATGSRTDVPALDDFVDRMDTLAEAIGYYLLPDVVDSWALDTYGSTALSALIGLVNAEYALRIGGDRAGDRVTFAARMAEHIDAAAFDGKGYAFGPARPGLLDLYPNVAMTLLDARLYELTGKPDYLARARVAYEAIQPLKLTTTPVRYGSPYSAEEQGAKTDDYSTLSSQNYLMLALAVLWEATKDPAFVEELDGMLDAVSTLLYGDWCLSHVHDEVCAPACSRRDVCVVDACEADRCQEGVLHHWMDGRAALPTDPTYFCSGCNLQLLYVMEYRRTRL